MSGMFNFIDMFAEGNQWFMLWVLAVFVIIIIHGILLAIGRALNMEELNRYAKSELMQAFATVVILASIVVLIGALEKFAVGEIGGGPESVGQISCSLGDGSSVEITSTSQAFMAMKCKLIEQGTKLAETHNTIVAIGKNKAQGWSGALGPITTPFDIIGSKFGIGDTGALNAFQRVSIYVSLMGVPIFSGSWMPSWYKEMESLRILNDSLTSVLTGMNVLLVLVEYLSKNMLTVFIPLGLILRSFYFTRGLGALFLAMGFSFYFIFPFLYVISSPGFVQVPTIPENPLGAGLVSCYPTFAGAATASEISGGAASISQIASISKAADAVSNIYTILIFHGLAVLGVTLMAVRYLSQIFGGEGYTLMRYLSKVI